MILAGTTEDIYIANRNYPSGGKIYSGHVKPVFIDCNFVVDSSNSNGLGISSLKGPYVQNVFMHTSSTAGAGNSNPATPNIIVTNPNPVAGTIVVQLQDNFNLLYTKDHSIISPSGTPTGSLTIGIAYVIISLGTTTAAQWHTAGVPAGIVPAVGVAFISAATASVGGTGTAAPSAAAGSNIFSIEVVGNSNLSIAPNKLLQGFGAQIILQCRNDSSADAPAIAAPADGSIISLKFLLSDSSVLVQGE